MLAGASIGKAEGSEGQRIFVDKLALRTATQSAGHTNRRDLCGVTPHRRARAAGGGQVEDLATSLDAVEQDQELGDERYAALGALGRAKRGDPVKLIEKNASGSEFLKSTPETAPAFISE